MNETSLIEIVLTIITLGGAVIGWLLSNRDEKQQAEMTEFKRANHEEHETIWRKHDEEVRSRIDLQREIDRNHYPKHELDPKLDRMLSSIDNMSNKFDKLAQALMDHMTKETVR